MSVNKISEEARGKLRNSSVLGLPDNPSVAGKTAADVKRAMVEYVTGVSENDDALSGTTNIVKEINRIVAEINEDLTEVVREYGITAAEVQKLLLPPDYVNAGNEATVENPSKVSIGPNGNFVFENLRGERGYKGAAGERGEKGEKGDDIYSFALSQGDLLLVKADASDSNVNYLIDDFGIMSIKINY